MKSNRLASPIDPADAAKGERAEHAFRVWLDASCLPHLYVEQSPITVPEHLRGQLKRPDYLVGIPGVGPIAFDVKAKTVYDDGLIFNVGEVVRLRNFARMFHLTVYFACLDPREFSRMYWVRLDQLDDLQPRRRNRVLTLSLPFDRAMPASMSEHFYEAFFRAVAL